MTDIPPALLVACGNVLRGDDGVGWHVAAAARAAVSPADLQVITCHQLTPELAGAVAAASRVVFVDASCEGTPGEVLAHRLRAAARPAPGLTQHHFDPADLLGLVHTVHGHAPEQAWLVTVGALRFELGESLSRIVAAAVEDACRTALRLLAVAPYGAARVL